MQKNVEILVHTKEGVVAKHSVLSDAGKLGNPLVIRAQSNMTYELKELGNNVAPERILAKRHGKNLEINLEVDGHAGEVSEAVDIIIEDYYTVSEVSLIGLAENGQFYPYVPESGDSSLLTSKMADGTFSYDRLGSDEVSATPMWMYIAGGAAGLGAIALAAGGGGGGGGSSTPAPPADTNDLGSITLNGAAIQGQILTTTLNDSDGVGTPVYTWSIDGVEIPNSNQSTMALTQEHVGKTVSVSVTYTDDFGIQTVSDELITKVMDTTAPGTTNVSIPEAVNGINATEASDGVAVEVTLPSDAVAGDVITISIDGSTPVSHAVTQGEIDAGTPLIVTLPKSDIDAAGQGAAVITTIYTDPSGNAITPITTNVTIDTIIPGTGTGSTPASVSVPEATDGINATEASDGVTVEVTLPSDAIAGDVITISIDGSTPVSHTVTQGDIDAGTSVVVTLPKSDIDEAGQGTAVITTTYTDPSGNAITPITTNVVIDTVVPLSDLSNQEIQSVYDDQGDVTGLFTSGDTTDDSKPAFSGIAEVNSTVSVYDNGIKIGETGVDVNGNWHFIPTNPLLLGDHSVTITATDTAGNTSDPSMAFDFTLIGTASPAAPAIVNVMDDVSPIIGNISKDTGVTNDTQATFSGTAQAGVTVTLYDAGIAIGSVDSDGSGNWSITPDIVHAFSDGVHAIVATATNAAGNVSPQSGAYTFRVDTSAPNVVGTAGTNFELIDNVAPVIGSIGNGTTTDDATPAITGTAEAGAIIQAFDGVGNPIGSPVVAASNGTWTINLSTPLSDGSHAISVTATDAAGNTSTPSVPITFTVDTSSVTTPIITNYTDDVSPVTGVFASDSTTNDGTPTFSGTAQNGTMVQLFINGVATGTPVAVSGGVWMVADAMLPSDGTHSVLAVSTNAAGTNTSSSAFIVTLDTQAPGFGGVGTPVITDIVDDVGIYQGSTLSGASSDDSTPTLKGTAEALSVITVTDSVGGTLGTTTTDSLGNWTFTPATPLANGTHNFTVTATDVAGNVSGASNVYSLLIDTIAPSSLPADLSITSAIDDQGVVQGALSSGDTTDDAKPEFSGKAEANALVTVFDNGVEIGTTQANSSGDWTFTPDTPLIAGDHSIRIKATDTAGNVSNPSTPPFDFTLIGADAPAAPAIVSVLDNVGAIQTPIVKDGSTDDTTPTFNGTAEAGATVTLFEGAVQLGQAVANAQGEWTITTSTLAQGDHAIYATATNAAGNVSPETGDYSFSVDTLAPSLPVINVVETDNVINAVEKSDGVVISGSAEAFSTVKLYDGANYLTSVTVDASGNWSVAFSSSQVPVDGTRNVRATATDAAGNISAAAVRVVTIETVAPNPPTINTIEGNDIINAVEKSDGVVLSGTAEVGTTVKLTYNGTDLGSVSVDTSGNWSLSFTAGQVPADGFATVVATATDTAGNVTLSTSKSVLIDTLAPVVPILTAYDDVEGTTGNIVSGTTINDAFPTLSGTGENGSTMTIYDGITLIGQTTVAANGTWSLELSAPLSDATHTLTAVSTDAAGNSSTSAALNFTVDASAVTAPTISNYFDDVPITMGNFGSGSSTNDTLPTFSGTTLTDTTVEVFVDGSSIGQATVAVNGIWSITPTVVLSGGAHTIHAVATNLASSTSQSSDFTFTIDTALPAAPTINDIETDNVINSVEKADGVTMSGTAEANAIVKLYNNTVYLGEVIADGSGAWSVSFGAGQVPVDGNYRVVATATDSVGNVSSETEKIVRIDTLAPAQPTINTVEGNNIINDAEKADGVVLSGTAEAGSSVEVDFGGIVKTVVATGGVWSASYLNTEVPVDGVYAISVTATDSAGNVSIPATQSVTIDTAAPSDAGAPVIMDLIDDVGSIQGSTPSGASSDDTTPTLRGIAEANTTINLYDGLNLLGSTTTDASGTWAFTPATALANGVHPFSITATDAAGNVSAVSNTYSVTIDTIAPDAPTVNTLATNDTTPVITGTAALLVGESLTVAINGATYNNVIVDGSGHWSIDTATATASRGVLGTFSSGVSYDVHATATDAAGNTASDTTNNELTITTKSQYGVGVRIVLDSDNDGIITSGEKGSNLNTSVEIEIPATAQNGDIIKVTNALSGSMLTTYTVGSGGVTADSLQTFIVSLPASGETLTIKATVNEGLSSEGITTFDSASIGGAAPVVSIGGGSFFGFLDFFQDASLSAYDADNNITKVTVEASVLFGFSATVSYSPAVAAELGLVVAASNGGIPFMFSTKTITITKVGGGAIDDAIINEFLATITTGGVGFTTTTTITATDATGLMDSASSSSFMSFGGGFSNSALIEGTSGNETLNGTVDSNWIYGYAGNDTLNGNGGDDLLRGGDGMDVLNGGDGNDLLMGGSGNDTLKGNAGNDTLEYDGADVLMDGGTGTDVLYFEGSAAIGLNLAGVAGSQIANIEKIDITGNTDNILTLSYADILAVSDTDTLYIAGDFGDTVDLTGQVFVGTESVEGIQYNRYDLGGTMSADIWVQQSIAVI